MLQAVLWGQYPARSAIRACSPPGDCVIRYGEHAIVSWGELAICAAWLALGVLMTWILTGPPADGRGMPDTGTNPGLQTLGPGGLQP
ncbi:MAG TPA: hypothetical protein VFQ44_17635 [Streptosporangiaceae bacterium]|nr:hypothetical protein [Streptosporangiaceae bacterium]